MYGNYWMTQFNVPCRGRGARDSRSSTPYFTSESIGDAKIVSTRTVWRELKQVVKRIVMILGNNLSVMQIGPHTYWTSEQWKRVVWSDESRFTLFQSDESVRVGRESHEAVGAYIYCSNCTGFCGQCEDRWMFGVVEALIIWTFWVTRCTNQWIPIILM